MNKRDFVRIINEEINNFDFLSNDEFLKEQETTDLLQNEDLQKQFICDSLLGKKDKVKILKIDDSYVSGDWEESPENARKLNLTYYLKIQYTYDMTKEPIQFELNFNGDDIDISVDGWYDPGRFGGTTDTDYPPEGESWYDGFDWGDIDVEIFTVDGDEIQFTAFENAPPKIQTLFIREYTQNFIESETLEFRTDDLKDNIRNTPYC